MSDEIDNQIASFCSITTATPQVARQYLQISDNDMDTAISLYMENDGKTLGSSTTNSAPVVIDAHGPEDESPQESNITSDEALARQLQEQENSRRTQQQSSEIRAPIAPKTEVLAGGSDIYSGGISSSSSSSALWQSEMRRQQRNQNELRPSVFNQGDSSSIHSPLDFLRTGSSIVGSSSGTGNIGGVGSSSNSSTSSPSGTDRSASPATNKTRRLADLFSPPYDIMFHGSFEDARTTAKDQQKWLLVNLQDTTEFSCQILNRDLWSDNFVKDIVRESFVFVQYSHTTPEGRRYLTFYPVSQYPHVAVIDSRTGERVKTWEKTFTPTDFMMEVTEFLEHHSPEAARSVTMKKPRQNISDMSEEEQLNAAIAASLQESGQGDDDTTTTKTESKTTAESSTQHPSRTAPIIIDEEDHIHEDESSPTSLLDSILPVKRTETTDIANSTRIQFRMADGSRMIRRFLKTDPVRYLFEFIKSQVPETQNQPFELVFNRQKLIEVLDQEIQEAGLQNAAVNVQFA
ncbi:unnamed protein product [Cunninghamella blakesleeana]